MLAPGHLGALKGLGWDGVSPLSCLVHASDLFRAPCRTVFYWHEVAQVLHASPCWQSHRCQLGYVPAWTQPLCPYETYVLVRVPKLTLGEWVNALKVKKRFPTFCAPSPPFLHILTWVLNRLSALHSCISSQPSLSTHKDWGSSCSQWLLLLSIKCWGGECGGGEANPHCVCVSKDGALLSLS